MQLDEFGPALCIASPLQSHPQCEDVNMYNRPPLRRTLRSDALGKNPSSCVPAHVPPILRPSLLPYQLLLQPTPTFRSFNLPSQVCQGRQFGKFETPLSFDLISTSRGIERKYRWPAETEALGWAKLFSPGTLYTCHKHWSFKANGVRRRSGFAFLNTKDWVVHPFLSSWQALVLRGGGDNLSP